MIESEVKRERLTDILTRWADNTKVSWMLRDFDIPWLVREILEEFYHVRLCCGHYVEDHDDGVAIEFDENDGSVVSGLYCRVCAEEYKRDLGAREI